MEAFRRRKLDRLSTCVFGVLSLGLIAGGYLAFSPASTRAPARPAATVRPKAPPPKVPEPVAESPDPMPSAPAMPAPAAQLPFKIRGVIYSAGGGSVVFVELAGKVGVYRVGDTVGDGWNVAAIGLESADLVRDGVTTSLSLERPPFKEPGGMAIAQAGMVAGESRRAAGSAQSDRSGEHKSDRKLERTQTISSNVAPVVPPPEARNSDAMVVVDKAVVEMARQDPASLVQGVMFEPIMNKGQMQGVQINAVPGDSYAARYGLASGDRIVAVNDQPINSLEQAWNLYNQFRTSNAINVTIERAGVRKVVTYYVP